MADNMDKRSQKAIDDTSIYIQDTLLSVSAKIGESLKDAVNEAFDGVDASVIKTVSNDLTRSFKSAAKFSDDIASNQTKILQGVTGTKDIEKQLETLAIKRSALARKIMLARRLGADINLEDLAASKKSLQVQEQQLLLDKKATEAIEKNMGSTGEIFKRLSKNKFFGSLVNAEEGLKAMRSHSAKTLESTGKGASKMSLFKKGIGASMKGLLKGPIIFTAILKVLKFVVGLFVSANKQTVALAKNLGVSKSQASVLRQQMVDTANASGNLYTTTDNLVDAQIKLTEALGRGGTFLKENLVSSTFLTKRLGMSDDSAAKLVGRFEAFGKNADQGVNNIIDLRNELSKSGENTATINQLLESVSQASGMVAASFGFSNTAIAKGVIQVRKFGLNLDQARSIASSLLDFESSIGNELEAELLTGRDLNLERARMMAMTGDIAGATEQVMSQMKGLTAEQRKSPIIMESLAKTIGLSVDELQDAYLLETDRSRQAEERIKKEQEFLSRAAGMSGKERQILAERMGIAEARREELNKNITVQEAFTESMAKAKDALSRFTGSGMLDKLTDLLIDFVERASQVGFLRAALGGGTSMKDIQSSISSSPENLKSYSEKTQTALIGSGLEKMAKKNMLTQANLKSLADTYGKDAVKKAFEQKMSATGFNSPSKTFSAQASQIKGNEVFADDFTIKTNPKDTLVMAGGTKFGEETNALLKELISAVREGGDVFIDGNKAGMALNLGAYRSSTA